MRSAAARISASGVARAGAAARSTEARIIDASVREDARAIILQLGAPRVAVGRGTGLPTGGAGEERDLPRLELAPLSGRELAEAEPADLHAHELEHLVADRAPHAPHLAVLALGQHELEPGRRGVRAAR